MSIKKTVKAAQTLTAKGVEKKLDFVTNNFITENNVCTRKGTPVGVIVWNAVTNDFESITADEWKERVKQEQGKRLNNEGTSYEEYEKWANGWDWSAGFSEYQGDVYDEKTLKAFIAETRKRELGKAVSEYRRKCKMTAHHAVRVRSRARSVRRVGRHVSRSFVAVGFDSGGDDGGGDGDGQSDCHKLAFAHTRKAEFVVVSARFGLALNSYTNSIATRKRALPAQEVRSARCGGRFFLPFWRWAA